MKPICARCKLFFRPKKNGFTFLEGMPVQNVWKPYKLWNGDLWECRGCGSEIIVGVIGGPLAEHFEDNFQEVLERHPPQLQVNDC